jgi:anaerobic magnesium-protoporphyrin IX monomethyl ester cyclase
MKVTLVYPDILEGASWTGYYYSGVGILAAVLKEAGHDVSLLHVTHELTQREFLDRLSPHLPKNGPKLVGFSVTSNMFPFARRWSRWVKEDLGGTVLFGGIHPTLSPEASIRLPFVDAICVGEGEQAIVEMVDRLEKGEDIGDLANIWSKSDGLIRRNAPRPPLADLDVLPFADRGIFDYPNLYHERQGEATMMVSRGCPYGCTYCCNHSLRKVYQGQDKLVRFRGVSSVMAELSKVLTDYPNINGFVFDDDILPLHKEWFASFAEAYATDIGRPFRCNLRPDLVDEATVRLLKRAGCIELRLGIESGNDRVRNEVLNRRLSKQDLVNAFELGKREGLRLYSFNMVGIPGEGMREMLDTVKLNAQVDADVCRVTIFYPYEQTELYEVCQKQRLLTDRVVTDYAEDTILRFSPARRNQILFVRRYFSFLVKAYRFLGKLRYPQRRVLTKALDTVLESRLAARGVFPAADRAYEGIRQNPRLDRIGFAVKKRLLG